MIIKKRILPPISDEEYLQEIKDIDVAIKIALETRKFEIELYWKRATYFWAFLVSAFGIYFYTYTMDDAKISYPLSKDMLLIFSSSIGLLLSLCFYFVNRGSKYWQENWEIQLDILLDKKVGPIFKRVKNPTNKFWCLLEPYPFSVSKVNILLSILMTIIWSILFIFSLGLFWNWDIPKYEECLCYFIIILTVSFVFLFFFFSRNFAAKSVGTHSKDKNLLKK